MLQQTEKGISARNFMSDAKFYEGYSRFDEKLGRYETWNEAVDRVMDMHRKKYSHLKDNPEFNSVLEKITKAYKEKKFLGAQRALQFGGEQLLKHESKIYNCVAIHASYPKFFNEFFYWALSGCGVGYSVQKHHVEKLPKIKPRSKHVKTYVIEDSIEGWADSVAVLLSSFFVGGGVFPEYEGKCVYFDSSKVRKKGSKISGGFLAPGPEPLVAALYKIESLLNERAANHGFLRPIDVYDITCHIADAVLSGGVRRCLPSGSKVHTKKGMINIEDINIGDLVLTSNGYRPVSNKFDQGHQKLVEVFTQDSSFKCTPNHKIAVLNGIDSYEWKMASELDFGDRIIAPSFGLEGEDVALPEWNYEKPLHSTTCRDVSIPELDEEIAWFLGFVQGDGYVRLESGKGSIHIPINRNQPENGDRVKKIFERFGLSHSIVEYENYFVIRSYSKQLAQYFHSWLKQPKTVIKVPEFIWRARENIKLAYIAGICDSDGSLGDKPPKIVTSIYKEFVQELQLLLSSCGIQSRISLCTGDYNNTPNWCTKYHLSVINNVSKDRIKNIPMLNKKHEIKLSKNERCTNSYPIELLDCNYPGNKSWSSTGGELIPVSVISVDETNEIEQTWDIEVEDMHEFFCQGYLVHNSATLTMFSHDDDDMLTAKTGNWFEENPQRARSNNSVALLRNQINLDQILAYINSIRQFGEPGFIFVDDLEITFNPCVEIGMYPIDETNGKPGAQCCNLTEINGSLIKTKEDFFEICEVASMMGTIQAGYTNFKYVGEETKRIIEREALLGVSITGWMNSPDVLLDPETLEKGARIVKETNKKVAKIIGINPAARTTCVKPSGNASSILGTSPATQGEHFKRYLRHMQINKEHPVSKAILETNPYMIEHSVWSSSGRDNVIAWPVVAPEGSKFKDELNGIEFLKTVKMIQKHWVNVGTNLDFCVNKNVRHNVSNTVLVKDEDWTNVAKFIFENKEFFAGISFIGESGDKDYAQAPFTSVLEAHEIVSKYGDGALFASGLIVDATKGFTDLWQACNIAIYNGVPAGEAKDNQSDWIRRFRKFAETFFGGDLKKAEYCLKDVSILHKWNKIQQTIKYVDLNSHLVKKMEIDINTMGGAACSGGGGCEFTA